MSEDKLNRIIEYLEDLTGRIAKIERSISNVKIETPKEKESLTIQKEESFMEFFRNYSPQKDTDKTLVIMYFLESRRKMENITTKDISEGFKEIREKTPANVSDKVQLLHKKGLITPGDVINNLRGWMITRSGLAYLEKLKNETG